MWCTNDGGWPTEQVADKDDKEEELVQVAPVPVAPVPVASVPVAPVPVAPIYRTVTANGNVMRIGSTDYTLLEDTLFAMKERGNINFRNKDYQEGITHFNEAIEMFKDAKWIAYQGDIKTKIT